MKNMQSFILGALTGAVIIACGGSSGSGSGTQTVKIESAQLNQLVDAIRGKNAKWQYSPATFKDLKKFGDVGWEMVAPQKDPKGNVLFLMKRPAP